MINIKKVILLMLCCSLLIICGLGIKTNKNVVAKQKNIEILSSKDVVETYFKYLNEKDTDKISTLFTDRQNSLLGNLSFKGFDYAKIKEITEESDEKIREGYLKNGPGSLISIKNENFIIFKVSYDIKYKSHFYTENFIRWIAKEEPKSNPESFIRWFTLIRTDSNSKWLIDEMGQQ